MPTTQIGQTHGQREPLPSGQADGFRYSFNSPRGTAVAGGKSGLWDRIAMPNDSGRGLNRTSRQARRASVTIKHGACLLSSIVGAIVVLGWFMGSTVLVQFSEAFPSMKISTAICFVFAGFLTYLMRSNGVGIRSQVLGSAATFGILFIMGSVAIAGLFGVKSGMESVFIRDALNTPLSPEPGMPALGTMAAFILIGVAGIAWIFERRKWIMRLYVPVAAIGLVAICGYLFNRPALYFYEPGQHNAMAVHTAALFAVLGICGCDKITLGKHKGESK